MTRVASFDVFDTVLARRVVTPEAVFHLLANRLGRDAAEFVGARKAAELHAWQTAKAAGGEVRLEDIHAQLGDPERTMNAELALERELLTRLPGAQERTRAARGNGARVAFVSDTPLPVAFVREVLREQGVLEEQDLVLVSSDCQVNKADGEIYRQLCALANVRATDVVHEGDNLALDVEAARGAGCNARLFEDAHRNRYEEALDQGPSLARAFAGASRLARLSTPATGNRERALRDVTTGVVAPLLAGYVLWVLQRARDDRLRTLWFLGRDGQVLLDIARTLAPRIGIDEDTLRLRYLHASRQAWNLPAFAAGAHGELNWIWDRTDDLTPRKLFARVGLTAEEIGPELRSHGYGDEAWDRALTPNDLRDLRPLVATTGVRARVELAASARLALFQRHLDEVGLLADEASGVVELTGHGNLQESLAAVVRATGSSSEPIGFYLALLNDGRERAMTTPRAWHESDGVGTGLLGMGGTAVVAIEAFAAADHGTLVEYAEQDGRVVPVLAAERNAAVIEWGLPFARRCVASFCRELILAADAVDARDDVREATATALRAFWDAPTEAEARAWGAFPWEDGFGRETRHLELARGRDWSAVLGALWRGELAGHRAAWAGGERELTSPAVRRCVELAVRARSSVRRVVRG